MNTCGNRWQSKWLDQFRSARVIEVLSKLISIRGAPRYLRSDNGPEFVSRALLKWVADRDYYTQAELLPDRPPR